METGLLLQGALVEKGSLVHYRQWWKRVSCYNGHLWKRVHLYIIGNGGKGSAVTMGTCGKGFTFTI